MKTGYFIDNIYYFDNDIKNGSIFQKCADNKIDLPCFCYHESLSIAGNCRMCLVETSNNIKLVVSCAMPVSDDIKIYTNNKRVKKARESVLEFLLINHPLDCPICDQGGECDSQDISLVFGSDRSRYYEYSKRAVFSRECGPLIKMLMTRCIHRTRCVRFLDEIAGTNDFGMLGRGEESEIGTYVSNSLIDELSGNIIDLCPVGALTSKPYSFRARPWELNSLESVDILDSMASNIRIDFLNNKVYRILPIYDINVNEDWITNKVRFSYDSNLNQRFYSPMIKIGDKFLTLTWNKSMYYFFSNFFKFVNNNIVIFYGMFGDFEEIINMNKFFNLIGTEIYLYEFNNIIKFDFRRYYITEKIVNMFENVYNIMFVGINLRLELPLINSRLRRAIKINDKIMVYSVGFFNSYLNFRVKFIGNSICDFFKFMSGRNFNVFDNGVVFNVFNTSFNKVFNFKVFIGIYTVNLIINIINYVYYWFDLYFFSVINNIVSLNLSLINIFELNNFTNIKLFNVNKSFVFLKNVDNRYFLKILNNDNFIVYHGHFFDIGAKYSSLLLPSLSNFEYSANFINLEGRIRRIIKVVSRNCITGSDLFIILKLYNLYLFKHSFSFLKNIKSFIYFFDFLSLDWIIDLKLYYRGLLNLNLFISYTNNKYEFICLCKDILFNSLVFNYYKTDVYTYNSKNMHLASLDYLNRLNSFI